MSEKLPVEVLKPKVGDVAPELFKTVLSTICPPAGFIAGLMQIYLGTPASRRAEAFIISIDEQLTKLEQQGLLNKEVLLQDPQFNTVVMHSTQIAVRTHREEKLEHYIMQFLIQFLLDTLKKIKPLIFLRTLDSLTFLI